MTVPVRDIDNAGGFTVRYDSAKGSTRVYVLFAIGIALAGAGFAQGSELLVGLGIAGLAAAYYFYPLVEARRTRLGANEYGIFIEGFGLIAWRSIRKVDLISTFVRTIEMHELRIQLNQPVSQALLADWRRLPFYRLLMRLPWVITANNTIRIALEPFAQPPHTIHRTLEAMWRHYRR
jgi:hypothetical protein